MRQRRPFHRKKAVTKSKTAGETQVSEEKVEEPAKPAVKYIELPTSLTVKQLSELLNVSGVDVIKQLMRNGVMAHINQVLDYEVAAAVAGEYGFSLPGKSDTAGKTAGEKEEKKYHRFHEEPSEHQVTRPPVVTIMGHVDHGKTSLLDAIRETNVIDTEAGNITQHIGAYQVEIKGNLITFLDTPGHEAFTAMRARGAQATDIAILVVAADEGVMPQTAEAIDHAKAAGVPILVAINKTDKPGANSDKVKQQLGEHNLLLEEWGGDVICVNVSAKMKEGISDLLENILVVAEVSELKANPDRPAVGVVIEAEMDKTRGPMATVLIQAGTLISGDVIVAGETWGKVKAMLNDKGKRVKKAGPSTPVIVMGLNNVCRAGDALEVVSSEKEARSKLDSRLLEQQIEAITSKRPAKLEDIYSQIASGQIKELNIILKTDVEGSIEPIKLSLEKLSNDQVKVRIIHSASGTMTESDVLLAVASKGIIIGFNARIEPGAKNLADVEGVDIRNYAVIYHIIEDVEKAMKGMLEPVYINVVDGRAEVKAVFTAGKKDKVAGVIVREGKF
ncbi:MAG: translation initiation factor IF-2, partial [Dehalococcoidia bacterium]|nr:translation initiation factor IF-2 [Dehalococcoidia bacterium]